MRIIGYESFEKCVNLKSVTIPGTVEKIESSAFANCDSLKWVTFEERYTDLKLGEEAFTTESCFYYFKCHVPPILNESKFESSSLPVNAKILVNHEYYNSYYNSWPQYAKSIVPVLEEDGRLYSVGFNKEETDKVDEGKTVTAGAISVTAQQTVWSDEQFDITYAFEGQVKDVEIDLTDVFKIVYGPQTSVKSSSENGKIKTVKEYHYILIPQTTGIYPLPVVRARLDGEEVQSPKKFIEIMHHNQ